MDEGKQDYVDIPPPGEYQVSFFRPPQTFMTHLLIRLSDRSGDWWDASAGEDGKLRWKLHKKNTEQAPVLVMDTTLYNEIRLLFEFGAAPGTAPGPPPPPEPEPPNTVDRLLTILENLTSGTNE